jgi:hypothetical protein
MCICVLAIRKIVSGPTIYIYRVETLTGIKFIKTNSINSTLLNATKVQNGYRFSLGKLQIDSNIHPLGFVTFPV